jgi:hypothetical protein
MSSWRDQTEVLALSSPPADVLEAADALGGDVTSLRPLRGASGLTWMLGAQVLRVGPRDRIQKEVVASAAAANAVPVPAVLDMVQFGELAATLWVNVSGRAAGDVVLSRPELASAIGTNCGEALNALATTTAPAGMTVVGCAATVAPASLLHLDLHPFNILVDERGSVAAIVDWANAAAGPSVLERARTWSVLFLDPAAAALANNPAWVRMRTAWADASDLEALSSKARAWACQFMLADLRSRHSPAELAAIAASARALNDDLPDDSVVDAGEDP